MVVAGYRIERLLGTGRMGSIYLAHNPDLPREDALKILKSDLFDDADFRTRFTHEADIVAGLTHPNIVPIYRRGTTEDGIPWIAMQYVEGTDADQALRQGTMTPTRAVHIVSEIAKALDYAHRRHVIHRDVKPSNFLLSKSQHPDEDEHVLLADFGISRPPGNTHLPEMATVAYAAPEVLRGADVDGRADLYSLGCSLFRLLTGRTPFSGTEDPAAATHAHLNTPPPKVTDFAPHLPPAFDAVVATAMAKDPRGRYQTGKALAAAAIAALQQDAPAPTTTSSPTPQVPIDPEPWTFPPPAPRRTQLNPRHLQAAALAAAALIGAGAIWLMSSRATSAPEDQPTATAGTEETAPSPRPRDPESEAQLARLLPKGYPPGSCTPDNPTPGSLAEMVCTPNRDQDGPAAGRYLLMPDGEALRKGLDTVINDSATTSCPEGLVSPGGCCPGGLLSPGAWRHNATPDKVAGTLFCGTQQGHPIVAWTTDDHLLLNITRAEDGGSTLESLYRWWTTHS